MIELDRLLESPALEAAKLCAINLADIEDTMQKHPALFAYAAASYEVERVKEARAKAGLERIRAEVFQIESQDKAVSRVKEEIDANPRVIAAQDILLRTQQRVAVLRAVVESLTQRRDMLIQLAARQRQEIRAYGNT